jgi:hypothetical protein
VTLQVASPAEATGPALHEAAVMPAMFNSARGTNRSTFNVWTREITVFSATYYSNCWCHLRVKLTCAESRHTPEGTTTHKCPAPPPPPTAQICKQETFELVR